jgi:hypothetical protein
MPKARAKADRERERAVLVQAEAAYTALVEARTEKDAAAATGERLRSFKARARHGCAAESDPQVSALRHGVNRVLLNDTPPPRDLDTFVRAAVQLCGRAPVLHNRGPRPGPGRATRH